MNVTLPFGLPVASLSTLHVPCPATTTLSVGLLVLGSINLSVDGSTLLLSLSNTSNVTGCPKTPGLVSGNVTILSI